MGLIRRFALPGIEVNAALLAPAAILERLTSCYWPYHHALTARLDTLQAQFGSVWHIDCHSMKSRGNAMNSDVGATRPDIVLGDLDGQSASPEFSDCIADAFERRGLRVARNNPYKGGYLVSRHGDPDNHRHSVQIEINRALYMDEARFIPSDQYRVFAAQLIGIGADICHFVREQINGRA